LVRQHTQCATIKLLLEAVELWFNQDKHIIHLHKDAQPKTHHVTHQIALEAMLLRQIQKYILNLH
jgi:hypothetical protein